MDCLFSWFSCCPPPPARPPVPVKGRLDSDRGTGQHPIINFYEGRLAPKGLGTTFEEVLKFDDQTLEDVHTYIQWLFPTMQPSLHNKHAEVANLEVIRIFRSRPDLQQKMDRAFLRMLQFYKLDLDEKTGKIGSTRWKEVPGHNYLRITRIISSLCLMGLNHRAKEFCRCMIAVKTISRETRINWLNAYKQLNEEFPANSKLQADKPFQREEF